MNGTMPQHLIEREMRGIGHLGPANLKGKGTNMKIAGSIDSAARERDMAEQDKDKGAGLAQTPAFDFAKMLKQFQIPGVDFASVVSRERKNIEALVQANRIAFEGWQNLVRRQGEMLRDSMQRAVEDAQKQGAKKNGVEIATVAFQKALSNMRELAEMATRTQSEAFEIIRKRTAENFDALRGNKGDANPKP